MGEAINEAELGRSKKSVSPADHLKHLLGLGWDLKAPLILAYVSKNHLEEQVLEWEEAMAERSNQKVAPEKLKKSKASNR